MAKSYLDQMEWVSSIVTDSIKEAEDILLHENIDICIVDVLMPKENGIDFVRRLKDSCEEFYITTGDFAHEKVSDKMNEDIIYARTTPKSKVINCLREICNGCVRTTV
jgi:response regulator of citrate/malate metabolism